MKAELIRDMTREEVLEKKREIEEELFNLRLKKRSKQLDNPLRLRLLGRDLARILTILKEDEDGVRNLATSGKLLDENKE